MTSPLFGDDDGDNDWPCGAYQAVYPKEPDMTRQIRIAESKKAGLRLWQEVQKELTKR